MYVKDADRPKEHAPNSPFKELPGHTLRSLKSVSLFKIEWDAIGLDLDPPPLLIKTVSDLFDATLRGVRMLERA